MTPRQIVQTLLDSRMAEGNSTFAIGGVSCFADSLVVAKSFVLRINITGKNPAHRKSAKRQAVKKPLFSIKTFQFSCSTSQINAF
jgi:hypothetical protein